MKMIQTKMIKPKNNTHLIAGLYAITPDLSDTERLCQIVEESILGGVRIVQYRNKLADSILRITQSRALLVICRNYKVPLIINDDVKSCLAIDADGVHIGRADGDIAATKDRIGNKILGASCYNQLKLAQNAQAMGADYIAFGACFSSSTKPNAVKADLSLFKQASHLGIPTVAIGGITLENASDVVDAGAHAVAVISALYSAPDVKAQAMAFSRLVDGVK
jgi:thiamine-phosphate pyrophosphorylase